MGQGGRITWTACLSSENANNKELTIASASMAMAIKAKVTRRSCNAKPMQNERNYTTDENVEGVK